MNLIPNWFIRDLLPYIVELTQDIELYHSLVLTGKPFRNALYNYVHNWPNQWKILFGFYKITCFKSPSFSICYHPNGFAYCSPSIDWNPFKVKWDNTYKKYNIPDNMEFVHWVSNLKTNEKVHRLLNSYPQISQKHLLYSDKVQWENCFNSVHYILIMNHLPGNLEIDIYFGINQISFTILINSLIVDHYIQKYFHYSWWTKHLIGGYSWAFRLNSSIDHLTQIYRDLSLFNRNENRKGIPDIFNLCVDINMFMNK